MIALIVAAATGGTGTGGLVVGGAGVAAGGTGLVAAWRYLLNGRTSKAVVTAMQAVPPHLLLHGAKAGTELLGAAEVAWANHRRTPQRGIDAKVEQRTTATLTEKGLHPDLAAHVANWAVSASASEREGGAT